jgi:hypothetical protein
VGAGVLATFWTTRRVTGGAGFLLLHVLISPFKSQARLEAEIVLLRHQLNVLRHRAPSKPKLKAAHPW